MRRGGRHGRADETAAPETPYPRVLFAVTLSDDRVVDRYGEHVGRIERLVINSQEGRIIYAIVALDTREPTEKLLAVPWRILRPDASARCFVFRGDRASIFRVPGIDLDAWARSRLAQGADLEAP